MRSSVPVAMQWLLLCSLCLFLNVNCHSRRQRRDVKYCENAVPGVEKLASGVDITKLDLNNDYSAGSIDGLMSSIVEFTCNKGKKFQVGGVQYDLPDQVDSMFNDASGVVTQEAQTIYTLEQKKETMGVEVELDVQATKGAFSGSAGYKKTQESMKNMSTFITSLKAFSATSKATLLPATGLKSNLDESFQAYVEELTGSYQSNPKPYIELIQNFGTHYLSSGQFGGTFSFYSEVNNEVRNKMSDEDIRVSAQADFLKILSVKGAYNQSTGTVDEFYKTNRRVYQRYFGGEANLLVDGSYKDWFPTVSKKPWLTHVRVLPITELIEDQTKRNNLKTAIEVYLLKADLLDMKTIMNNLASAMADPSSRPRDYTARVDDIVKQDTPDMYELEKLDRELADYTLTPKWFLLNVVITIGYSCPGGAQRLSGHPNQFIPDRPIPKNADSCLSSPFNVEKRGAVADWFDPKNLKLMFNPYIFNAKYDDPSRDYALWLKATQFCVTGRYYGWGNKFTDREACVRPGIYGFNSEESAPRNSDGLQDYKFIIRTSY